MRVLAFIGVLAIIAVIFAVVFFVGGFYNVAASNDNPPVLDWVLTHIRQASIARHADVSPSISLDDATLVQAGARAFQQRGCTTCHGGPGVDWAKFSEGINPGPPDLVKDVVPFLQPAELFWVVKNGVTMTAMPSFGSIGVGDQEIWSIVAFLRKLPIVSEADYKSWTSAPAAAPSGGNP